MQIDIVFEKNNPQIDVFKEKIFGQLYSIYKLYTKYKQATRKTYKIHYALYNTLQTIPYKQALYQYK